MLRRHLADGETVVLDGTLSYDFAKDVKVEWEKYMTGNDKISTCINESDSFVFIGNSTHSFGETMIY